MFAYPIPYVSYFIVESNELCTKRNDVFISTTYLILYASIAMFAVLIINNTAFAPFFYFIFFLSSSSIDSSAEYVSRCATWC